MLIVTVVHIIISGHNILFQWEYIVAYTMDIINPVDSFFLFFLNVGLTLDVSAADLKKGKIVHVPEGLYKKGCVTNAQHGVKVSLVSTFLLLCANLLLTCMYELFPQLKKIRYLVKQCVFIRTCCLC